MPLQHVTDDLYREFFANRSDVVLFTDSTI